MNENDSLRNPMVVIERSNPILLLPAVECNRTIASSPAGALCFSFGVKLPHEKRLLRMPVICENKNRTKIELSSQIVESSIIPEGNIELRFDASSYGFPFMNCFTFFLGNSGHNAAHDFSESPPCLFA